MFNGYEIWKSDSQKCTTYRVAQKNGAMCGRCMKTCPWNLEGLFAEEPFRRAAMTLPSLAPLLAKLDDKAGKGGMNPVKKWWWDLEMVEEGAYGPPAAPPNLRDLQPELDLKYEDQTLAVYPAPLAPPPWPWPFPMDREKGIEAYRGMISAEEHRRRRARGLPPEHVYAPPEKDASVPVRQVVVSRVTDLTDRIRLYEFRAPDGAALPPATAGAHIDVVVAPEFFRQYSLSGDPADSSTYQIAVLREDQGKGGSKLMHRIFTEGRTVFVSTPHNHFPLEEAASHSYLMGGGIGVTPMIAMAHRLHALGRPFELHYSVRTRAEAGFLPLIEAAPWADRMRLHVSDEGSRCDLAATLRHRDGAHVYTCGPDSYMQAVMAAAEAAGFPEDARRLEYFSVPELPEYQNHPFTLELADGRRIEVGAEEAATDALARAGVHVDVKCSDGLCGVCQCGVREGAVEHRDFVLSNRDRETRMILCQSRAAEPGGVLKIAL
jgi:ferredoxin-NADP reductase